MQREVQAPVAALEQAFAHVGRARTRAAPVLAISVVPTLGTRWLAAQRFSDWLQREARATAQA